MAAATTSSQCSFAPPFTFEDLGRSRTRLTLHAVFPSAAERDRVIKEYKADTGTIETLAQLAEHLAKMLS